MDVVCFHPSGDVTHETTPLDIVIEGHHNIIAFNILKSPINLVVLGLFWLNIYNLAFNWKTQRLTFQPSIASIQESGYGETSSVPGHHEFNSHHGEISKTQVPLIVGARAFTQAVKKRMIFIIYATPIIESVKGLEALSTHYK
jgi:hypothetical protein